LHLSNGKTTEILSTNNNSENVYVDNLKINGKSYTHNYLNIDSLKKGVKLLFRMSNIPNKKRGIEKSDLPYSMTK
jgi:putative alpha-1,2-mannosidase